MASDDPSNRRNRALTPLAMDDTLEKALSMGGNNWYQMLRPFILSLKILVNCRVLGRRKRPRQRHTWTGSSGLEGRMRREMGIPYRGLWLVLENQSHQLKTSDNSSSKK